MGYVIEPSPGSDRALAARGHQKSPLGDETVWSGIGSQRQWPVTERIQMLGSLTSFMLPMAKHVKLCYALDSMLRRGYVNRAPKTVGHSQVSQDLYEMQQRVVGSARTGVAVQPALPKDLMLSPAISTALVGISGMGKTTTVRRFCAMLPEVRFIAITLLPTRSL